MIEDLKDEDIINQVGGRFRLTALIQKRWRELMYGARPMVDPGKMTPLETVVREIKEGKIVPRFGEPESDESAESQE